MSMRLTPAPGARSRRRIRHERALRPPRATESARRVAKTQAGESVGEVAGQPAKLAAKEVAKGAAGIHLPHAEREEEEEEEEALDADCAREIHSSWHGGLVGLVKSGDLHVPWYLSTLISLALAHLPQRTWLSTPAVAHLP